MQFKALSVLALSATLATATVTPVRRTSSEGILFSGCRDDLDALCCQRVQQASSPGMSALLGLLGIVVQDLNTPIGTTCTPLIVLDFNGNSCNGEFVCCTNNNFNGLVAIGCTPVGLSS